MITRPTSGTQSALYGMDVKLANLLGQYDIAQVGERELASMDAQDAKRSMIARLSFNSEGKYIILSVIFEDAHTGRTGASLTSTEKGELFEAGDRDDIFKAMSKTLIQALERDNGLLTGEQTKKPMAAEPQEALTMDDETINDEPVVETVPSSAPVWEVVDEPAEESMDMAPEPIVTEDLMNAASFAAEDE
ncbi:hypothetical protein RM530_14290 [Algiphilus sp. W345]|uniref:Uncharacterized protein n=1 Tax=Banduia mediterranea TaxID=3075609 RepID=A0ABU2WKV3_9GAMM|nr:hypothetical protein [Algiphilus sp. W345]MDT0498517.1 hypothetical protein [Algiphilus sp. W345]